jgi:hypothetical protein
MTAAAPSSVPAPVAAAAIVEPGQQQQQTQQPPTTIYVDTQHDDMVHDARLDYYGTKLATGSSGAFSSFPIARFVRASSSFFRLHDVRKR